MSQISFADAEYAGKRKKTRREIFLEEMELVVPWKALLKVIEPFYPVAGRGRRPYTPRRVSFMRNTVPTAYTTVQTVVTVASGHVRRNQRSRCRNPSGHVHRNVGHDPGITGHVGPEYSLYQIERQVKSLSPEERQAIRQSSSKPLCEDLHAWLMLERQRVPEGSATAKAIDYSLNRWEALTNYLADGNVQSMRPGNTS